MRASVAPGDLHFHPEHLCSLPPISRLVQRPGHAALSLMFMWWIGDGLEQAMGAFKLNVFYLLGMIGTTIAAFFFGSNFDSSAMLNASLFYAFARFYPDVMIYVFYVLPIDENPVARPFWIRYPARCCHFGRVFCDGEHVVPHGGHRYLVFFGPEIWREAGHLRHGGAAQESLDASPKPLERAIAEGDEALHRCEVCKRTEISSPDLDFRVSSDGHEYCVEHLPAKPPVA